MTGAGSAAPVADPTPHRGPHSLMSQAQPV